MVTFNRVPSHHITTLKEFEDVVQKSTEKAECGRNFIRVEKLMEWLKSPSIEPNPRTQIYRLAFAAYRETLVIRPPIEESILLNDCPLTFCILVELGHGHLVHEFQRYHLIDRNLETMDSSALRSKIERDMTFYDTHSEFELSGVAERFDKLRWKYFAPKFELRRGEKFPKDCILPIVQKQAIKNGGTAKLHRIEILEEFVGTSLREEVCNSVKVGKDGADKRYFFALKTFEERNKPRFENELMAFTGLKEHKGMVKYLGNFYRDEFDGAGGEGQEQKYTTTYNILLQYGECDLTEYFIQNYPPLFPDDVHEFWQDLFEVAETVKGIHTIKDSHSHQTYLGWHADIKPDNILLVQGKFKLADPGFMKFVLDQPGNTHEAVREVIEGGTRTYGAPEMHTKNFSVSQTIDTWSLGCVFSIAATWFVIGLQGVVWFSNIRSDGVKALGLGSSTGSKEQGDQFHDGEKVLDAVKNWHNFLRGLIRNTDHITSQVLDIVDKYMLVKDPDERDKAEALCVRLQELLKTVKDKPQASVSNEVIDSFKEANSQAPILRIPVEALLEKYLEKSQRPTGSEERKHRKSEIFELVTNITARPSRANKRGLLERSQDRNPAIETATKSSGESQPANTTGTKPIELPERPKRPSRLSIIRKKLEKPSSHIRHDVFEAREALESESLGRFPKVWKPKRADDALSDHYNERDIIFLVDNAESMGRWWSQTKFVLGTLFLMMSQQPNVGMQMLFTLGHASMPKMKREDDVKKLMSNEHARPRPHRRTDMEASLGDLFEEHVQSIKNTFRKRLLTLIILTDGLWKGTRTKAAVKAKIAKFVKEVSKLQGQHRKRPVSIQFIQLGKDMDAMFFLQHLDDHLGPEEGIEDVIDYEPAEGDVYKMLLGSFVEDIDSIGHEEAVVQSPPSPGSHDMSLGS